MVKYDFPLVDPCSFHLVFFLPFFCLEVVSRIGCSTTFQGIKVRSTDLFLLFYGKISQLLQRLVKNSIMDRNIMWERAFLAWPCWHSSCFDIWKYLRDKGCLRNRGENYFDSKLLCFDSIHAFTNNIWHASAQAMLALWVQRQRIRYYSPNDCHLRTILFWHGLQQSQWLVCALRPQLCRGNASVHIYRVNEVRTTKKRR